MPLSYYRNAHAKCDFEESQNKFQCSTHERDAHERIYKTKHDEIVFKAQISKSRQLT